MKWKIEILLFVIIILNSCAPKLSKQFYDVPSDILIQKNVCYMPNGYHSMASANYPGVFAIVKDKIVFDTRGPGSRPWMIYLQPFKINIHDITSIKLSKELALKRKVITVYTKREQYHFYMNAADSVYLILDKKIKKTTPLNH